MNIFHHFRGIIIAALERLQESGDLPHPCDFSKVTAEPPRDSTHGHVASNAAMVLAKAAQKNPIDLAEKIKEQLEKDLHIKACTVAKPGFINLTLSDGFIASQLQHILRAGIHYGDSHIGEGEAINVEYVSTNPTGPIHIGHCRGAVFGDVLAHLLSKVGYKTTKEYYINDAGTQADQIARSAYARYCQVLGRKDVELGEYPGEYLEPVGQALAEKYGDAFLDKPEETWLDPVRTFTIHAMMDLIRADLLDLNITHDVFTSERHIVKRGGVDEVLETFRLEDLVYTGILEAPKGQLPEDWEARPQELFRSTLFGDDVDRPLKKSDGSWTYFATDIAYHYDKYKRGFKRMINVWGADHAGYVKRLSAAVEAITQKQAHLDVKLCQMVKFMDNGEAFKMSKRAGTFVSVKDVVERVGTDVVRFMMMTRKNDAPLDFDFAKVVEQSKDNPVFYVQYAHARCCSIRRHAIEIFPHILERLQNLSETPVTLLTNEAEQDMILLLAHWPRQVETAALTGEPHRLAYYLNDVAAAFHALWTKGRDEAELRFIFPQDEERTVQKLALTQAVATVIASGLAIFGVKPVEEMR